MTLPNQFFTPESFLTLTGAAGATFAVSNGLQSAFNFNPNWVGLGVAEVITIVGTFLSSKTTDPRIGVSDILLAIPNGFLVYAAATGTTHIAGASGQAKAHSMAKLGGAPGGVRRSFLTPWF